MLRVADFKSYQRDVFAWLPHRTEAFVWLPLGAGKTAVAAHTFAEWRRRYGLERALVVGTTKIVTMTWPNELEKWEALQGLSYAAAVGSLRDRVEAVRDKPDVLGVNYENLRWLLTLYDGKPELPTVLILDEISKMKDHGTKRFKALQAALPHFERRIGLTATPAAEGYVGLWAQEASVSSARRLGKNITAFRAMHCTTKQVSADNHVYVVSPAGKAAIQEKLAPITFNLTADDYPELRSHPTVVDVPVGWSVPHRYRYDKLEDEFLVELERGEVVADNAGVLANKLRQLCAGCIYDKEGQPVGLDTEKLEALDEAIEALNGEKALVFYQYRWEQKELLRRLPGSRSLDKPRDLTAWNKGEVPYLVLHPASAGHGLNLQESGCTRIVWFSLPWSLEQYLQANARIDRPAAGGTSGIWIYRLLRERSIELDVADRLAGKITTQDELLAAVRARRLG